MGRLNGRTADVNSPPVTSPFTVDERGLLTSRPWLVWLSQLFRGVQATSSLANGQMFDPPGARDIQPEIQEAAALAQETRGRDIGPEIFEVAEL
ncbi:MAG: hypothetical protein ACRD9L_27230, partial [Bryobacteraceae bacterium]